jgi:predicted nucleotidyltransferase
MLAVSIFHGIIKNEVGIHGVRLITDFYKRGVLLRDEKKFASSIKTLFYYETTMSKVMDLVMLQAVLSHVFQMSIDITQFSPSLNWDISNHLRKQKIDGTDITQVLTSMMTWTSTRSLMDELDEDDWAFVWPTTSITHRMLAGILGKDLYPPDNKFDDINVFMRNVLKSIQGPFTSFEELKSNERKFMLGNKSCYSNFHFLAGTPNESSAESYLCVMDITAGHVICRGGRMSMKIVYVDPRKPSSKSRKNSADEVWMLLA